MKYLKLFEEHDSIPDNFIRLNSIGHVLDPENGLIYAIWKKGGYDHENPYDVAYDDVIDGISDEDMEIVNKYWKSCESIAKDKINWNLIQTAKDLSLGYLDDGYELVIEVVITKKNDMWVGPEGHYLRDSILLFVYIEMFSHIGDSIKWNKYFNNKINIIKSNPFTYRFTIQPKKGLSDLWGVINWEPMRSRELTEHLKEIFPKETIIRKMREER